MYEKFPAAAQWEVAFVRQATVRPDLPPPTEGGRVSSGVGLSDQVSRGSRSHIRNRASYVAKKNTIGDKRGLTGAALSNREPRGTKPRRAVGL